MAEIYSSGLLGAGQFRSYDITPKQAIIFGTRGANHTITAAQAGNYFYNGLTGQHVSEGRQFLDIDSMAGNTALKMVDGLYTESDAQGTLILNASSQWQTVSNTGRRYMRISILDWNTKQSLYNFGLTTGEPYGTRLNLAQTTIVQLSAFDTTPDHQIVPVLEFYGESGDLIMNWGFTAIYQ